MNDLPLPRAFFQRDAETVARDLVGCVLVRRFGPDRAGQIRRVRLVETEAYVGPHDLACHASKGRTARTEVMFGAAGHLYVYLIYGLYHMVNIVTGPLDDPQAVLLRAAEPLENVALATNGPGRLARALDMDRRFNGLDLCAADPVVDARSGADQPPPAAHTTQVAAGQNVAQVWLVAGPPPGQLVVTTRIGVGYAGEWSAAPLRFYDADSRYVSVREAARAAIPRRGGRRNEA